jgi:hypothetical protein
MDGCPGVMAGFAGNLSAPAAAGIWPVIREISGEQPHGGFRRSSSGILLLGLWTFVLNDYPND